VAQTSTGYWVVRRGGVNLAGCPTREAAEGERVLLEGLRSRSDWRHRDDLSSAERKLLERSR
jgi:hypothetical protein